jgi:hypothetical protein
VILDTRSADGAPWELTGNHYLALPWIGPADGTVHGLNVLHRGMASLVSWTAARDPDPGGVPFLRLRVTANGAELPLVGGTVERIDRWIPRWRFKAGGARISVTICAPGGFDPLAPGAVIQVGVENAEGPIRVALEGCWCWTLKTGAVTKPSLAPNRAWRRHRGLVLEAGEMPNGAALAVAVEGRAGGVTLTGPTPEVEAGVANGECIRFELFSGETAEAKANHAFVLGVAPEGEGAWAAAERLARIGAEELIRRARLDLASLNRASDDTAARDMVGRNLVFHHYFAAARAIDDDRLYPVLSRSPDYGPCAVYGETETLAWSLPAYALTDPLIARELLMRVLEMYSDRPGNVRRYVDGNILDAGYSLARALEYGLAVERYVEITRDEAFAGEPLVQQVLRELDEGAWSRLHPEVFLAATEVLVGGEPADYAYSAWANALLWRLGAVIDRWLRVEPGASRPRFSRAATDLEAAFWQRFTTEVEGLTVIAGSSDLKGHAAVYDDPAGSLRLLPYIGLCSPEDPIWSNTMELLHSASYPLFLQDRAVPGFADRSRPAVARLSTLCSDLLTPWRPNALKTLRSLDLPAGVACEAWDPDSGAPASGPYAAAEAGFLVWALLVGAPHDEAAGPVVAKRGER